MADDSFSLARLSQILHKTYFFQSLKMQELDDLVGHMRAQKAPKGATIIKQGDPGLSFYLIASGRVSVWVKKAFSKAKVAELFPDQFFGEMALISHEPRSATIVAEEDTTLFVLNRMDFEKILMKNPAVAQELKKAFFERKQRNK
ncbi:MAG TPA: cyclic nucleotide-binding domain-containing protein [bacterium]|nr:cyclic nucleotide-binding domain-containing protein [bacterium]